MLFFSTCWASHLFVHFLASGYFELDTSTPFSPLSFLKLQASSQDNFFFACAVSGTYLLSIFNFSGNRLSVLQNDFILWGKYYWSYFNIKAKGGLVRLSDLLRVTLSTFNFSHISKPSFLPCFSLQVAERHEENIILHRVIPEPGEAWIISCLSTVSTSEVSCTKT